MKKFIIFCFVMCVLILGLLAWVNAKDNAIHNIFKGPDYIEGEPIGPGRRDLNQPFRPLSSESLPLARI